MQVKFYLKHAERGGGGGTKSFEVVLTWKLEYLAKLMGVGGGGAKSFDP